MIIIGIVIIILFIYFIQSYKNHWRV